jgi:hypothetical protein
MIKSASSHSGKCLAAIVVLTLWSHVCAFALALEPIRAAPITLAWELANDPSIQGYRIYFGPINQLATNHIDAGTNLTVTLFDLLANTRYWLYAVSYDAAGNESVPSNLLLLTPPALSPVRIARLATGDIRLALRAAPGSVCQVEYADAPNSSIWQALNLATADANGNLAVIDPSDPQISFRFYRAVRFSNPPPSKEPQTQ